MRLQIIICTLVYLIPASYSDSISEYLLEHTTHYNHPDLDEAKIVCDALKVPAEGDHETFYKLSTNSSYEDVLKLTVWNLKGGFKYRKLTHQLNFPKENWRKLILDDLFDIFKLACHNAYVPDEFLNVIYEMVMIYYNNAMPKIKEDMDRWNATSDILQRCKAEMHQFPLHDVAGTITYLDMGDFHISVGPTVEMVDTLSELDVFVDTLWWIFSFSYGACYYPAGYRSVWAPKYKKIFYEDFLTPLLRYWTSVEEQYMNFGVMIGNFDVAGIMYNIRTCTSAAYAMYGIQDRELIRPIVSPITGESNSRIEDDYDNGIDDYY